MSSSSLIFNISHKISESLIVADLSGLNLAGTYVVLIYMPSQPIPSQPRSQTIP